MALKPENIRTAADARRIVEERGLTHVKVGVFDVDGVLRGKYISKVKFFSALESGFGFCDVVLGWDSNDQLYDNVTFTGWHTAYPDASLRILPETCRALPFEENTLLFLCEFVDRAEAHLSARHAPPGAAAGGDTGLRCRYAAFEYEFFLFDETPESVREKNYRNLKPTSPPASSAIPCCAARSGPDLYHEILDSFEAMRIPIEGLHTETGPGVLEAALYYDLALEAADRAALFKTFMKVLAQRRGLDGHLHGQMVQQLSRPERPYPHVPQGKDGKAPFHDPKGPHGMSKVMQHFVAGQQALMPELLAHDRPDGELLFPADSGLLGADQRHLGRREPHLRAARDSRLGQVAARRVPDRRRRRQSLSRPGGGPWRRASTASSTSWSSRRRSKAMPMSGSSRQSPPCPRPCGRRRSG